LTEHIHSRPFPRTLYFRIGTTFEQTLGSTDAFITQLVAYARYSHSPWPFVTMPSFAIHATKLLKLSKAFYFSVYPFVEPWERDEWQSYANASDDWIYESLDIQAKDEDWWGEPETSFGTSYEIYSGNEAQTAPYDYMNNYLPTWQIHPVVPKAGWGRVYNYDIWYIEPLAQAILAADKEKRVVVSPQVNAIYDPTSEDSIASAKSQSDWAAYYARPGTDTSEPFSVITFPIYDSLETVRLDTSKNHSFVAVLTFSLFWRELLTNVLPEGSDGVIVVFSDPCSPAFTYRLDGPKAIYLGQGDLHDSKYDGHGVEHQATLPDLANPQGKESSSYTGLPIHDSHCLRTITVYPSDAMEDNHTSKDPVIFTVAAACIFLFTSAIFVSFVSSGSTATLLIIKMGSSDSLVNCFVLLSRLHMIFGWVDASRLSFVVLLSRAPLSILSFPQTFRNSSTMNGRRRSRKKKQAKSSK
jgi:hypothetical protein